MTKTCPECGKSGMKNVGMHIAQTDCTYPSLSENHMQILRGVLMGDGHIRPDGIYEVSVNEREYLEYLKSELPEWFVSNSGISMMLSDTANQGHLWRLRSVTLDDMKKMRDVWYPDGKKRYPINEIELDSVILRHWYCTDGGLDGYGRPCLYSSNEDTIELRDWLKEEGFDVCRDSNTVRFNKDGAQLLYEMVETCPGYEYKLAGLEDV